MATLNNKLKEGAKNMASQQSDKKMTDSKAKNSGKGGSNSVAQGEFSNAK